jgi:hypothetical protein
VTNTSKRTDVHQSLDVQLGFQHNQQEGALSGIIHFCTFLNFYKLKSKLDKIPQDERAVVDFSLCSFVDHTVQESLQNYE